MPPYFRMTPFIGIFLAVSMQPCAATSVVVIWTPTEIVMGADSMGTSTDGKEARPLCKITVANNVIVGKAGVYFVPKADYRIDDVINASIGDSSKSIGAKAANIENTIVPTFTTILRGLSIGDPLYYASHFAGQAAVEFVLIGRENGVLRLEGRDFVGKSDSFGAFESVQVIRTSCPGSACAGAVYLAMGEHKVIDQEIARNRQMYAALGLSRAVTHLIESQIAAAPDRVGPPISLIRLTSKGYEWISGECDSNQNDYHQ